MEEGSGAMVEEVIGVAVEEEAEETHETSDGVQMRIEDQDQDQNLKKDQRL